MKCPDCPSEHIRKNGLNHQGKQNHICVNCSRQFIDSTQRQRGYSQQILRDCLKIYLATGSTRFISSQLGVLSLKSILPQLWQKSLNPNYQ